MIPASYAHATHRPTRRSRSGVATRRLHRSIVNATRPVGGCPTNMKLAAVGALLAVSTVTAHAETSFDEYSETVPRRPTQQLVEAACDLDIQVRGRSRRSSTPPDRQPRTRRARVELPLRICPAARTLTGFSRCARVRAPSRRSRSPERSPRSDAEARPVFGIDPAFVRGAAARLAVAVRLRLQPLTEEREVTITLRYSALAENRAGALRLVIPGRPNTGKLAACSRLDSARSGARAPRSV